MVDAENNGGIKIGRVESRNKQKTGNGT